jgi:hypothetical protein
MAYTLWDRYQENILLQGMLDYLKEKPSYTVAPIES